MKLVTCKNQFLGQVCNWVSFNVSREYAETETKSFNKYFKTLPKKIQKEFYGGKGASITFYEQCFRCGGSYKNFKRALKKEIPLGSTMQPIIDRKE